MTAAIRLAVIGTGIMGGPIAVHLRLAGHDVRVWDIDPAHSARLSSNGIEVCRSAEEAAAGADVIFTMVTDVDSVLEAIGERNVLGGFDGLWIQTTTVGIDGTEALAALARRAGVTFVDAPLLGTRSEAEAGSLTALASGPFKVEARVRQILDAICSKVLWLGEAGQGSRLKLVVNSWVLGLTALLAETMALSAGLGLEETSLLEIIRDGPLDSGHAQSKGAAIASRSFPPSLPLRLAAKDAALISAAGRVAGVDLAIMASVRRRFEEALVSGHGDEDYAAVWYSIASELHDRGRRLEVKP